MNFHFLALSTSYIFVLVIDWKCFSPDFPQFIDMSGFEDVRMSGCPDIETMTRDLESFFRSQGQFLSEIRSRMTKFKLFKCSHLPYNFPSSSVKILRFYFHFWLELDRVSSTYIRMDPSSGLILA